MNVHEDSRIKRGKPGRGDEDTAGSSKQTETNNPFILFVLPRLNVNLRLGEINYNPGDRLPIVQGGTFAFLVPTFAILNLPEWKCPAPGVMANMTYEDKTELWQLRMREVQGAIVVASVFQFAIGVFGIVGLILRFITPLTIAPAIVMVGLSLFGAAGNMAGKHWGISGLTIFLVIVFSQYLKNVKCPLPTFRKGQGWGVKKLDIFTLLPVDGSNYFPAILSARSLEWEDKELVEKGEQVRR